MILRHYILILVLLLGKSVNSFNIQQSSKDSDREEQDKNSSAYKYCKLARQTLDNDPAKGLAYARKGLELYNRDGDVVNRSTAYYYIGVAHKHLGQFDSALYYYKLSYKERLLNKTDPLITSEVLNGMGIIYAQQGVYSEGLANFMKAQEIYEKYGDSVKIAKGLTNIANIYYSMNQVDRAIPYYLRSVGIKERLGDEKSLNTAWINLAGIFIEKKQFKEAKVYINKVLNYAIKTNDKGDMATAYLRMGGMYVEMEELKNGLNCFEKSLAISNELNDQYGIMAALQETGAAYYEMKDYKNAIKFSLQALEYAKKTDSKEPMCDITATIARVYGDAGDYKTANSWLLTHINYYTNLQQKYVNEKTAELQQKFEVADKEKKLVQLSTEKANREIELYKKKSQLNYILTIAVAIIVLLSFVYYRYSLKQKNIRLKQESELSRQRIEAIEEKRLLQEKQQNELLNVIINVQEEERRKIAVDIHDGLGQLLSGIKLNLQLALNDKSISPNTKETLQGIFELNNESISESRNIASDLLPYNIKDYGLVTAIKNLCYKNNQLKISNINFYSTDVPRKLPSDIEITIYRITQELINNALKHARASEIFVQLFHRDNKLVLQIEDNGIGFLKSEAEKKTNSMGLKNIDIRVKLLAGHLEIDSVEGKGTTTLVEFIV